MVCNNLSVISLVLIGACFHTIFDYLHIPADRIFHPDTAMDGVKKQKLLLMLQECDEQEAAEILPAIEYLLALIHKRGNSC